MSASLAAARPQPTATAPLFSPYLLGQLRLPNRIVMAPLTRARADEHGVPSELAAEYYAQHAGAGLIIAEATAVSRQGTGYDNWPGLYTAAQEAGWRTITDAVHAAGGRIFVQLFHAGRMSHPVFHDGEPPVGPSPIAADPATELYDGMHPFTEPRALRVAELTGITGQFRAAAERALAAGFDGVEVHAGNGYLLDQFLRAGANRLDDAYGGNPRNRARLLREVTAAVIGVCGKDRVGVRISPLSPTNGMAESDPVATGGAELTSSGKTPATATCRAEQPAQPVSRAPATSRIHEGHVRLRQREVPDQVVSADVWKRAQLLQLLLGEHPRRHRTTPTTHGPNRPNGSDRDQYPSAERT